MTEDDWLTTSTVADMMDWSGLRKLLTPRKVRLYLSAFARMLGEWAGDPYAAEGADQAERYANQLIDDKDVEECQQRLRRRMTKLKRSRIIESLVDYDSPDPDYDPPLRPMTPNEATRDEAYRIAALACRSRYQIREVTPELVALQSFSLADEGGGRGSLVFPRREALPGAEGAFDPQALREGNSRLADIARDILGNPFRPVKLKARWRSSTATQLARHIYESRDFSAMPILADALQDAGCDSEEILNHCRNEGKHARGCWCVDLVLGKV